MTPSIVYDKDGVWVIEKPAGMHSVGSSKNGEGSVAEWLHRQCSWLQEVGDRAEEAGLVNRLDLMTSGLLLGAKTRECWLRLRESLKKGEFYKEYKAVLEGRLDGSVCCRAFIGSPYRRSKKVKVLGHLYSGQKRFLEARSCFELCGYDPKCDASLVRVVVATARRHQIRAHAAWLGHPLLGDELYGAKGKVHAGLGQENVKSPDFLLHASRLKFVHPVAKIEVDIYSEPQWVVVRDEGSQPGNKYNDISMVR